MVDQPVTLECPKDDCGYSWKYTGKHEHPAKIQCRACKRTFEIPEDPVPANEFSQEPRVI